MAGEAWNKGFLKMCTGVARLVLQHRQMRRQVMFYGMLGVVVQVAVGIAFLESFLLARPVLFALYWLGCLAAVLFLMLLALYDFLSIRVEAKLTERQLREELRREIEGDDA